MDENQIILIDKPAGISSFGVVAKVRARLKNEFGHKVKVGHTGTLDPFATGLLILLSGKMTKKSNEFLKLDKVYEATLKLGFTSTTGDPEGEIQQYSPSNSEGQIQQQSFSGTLPRARLHGARSFLVGQAGPTNPSKDVVESAPQSFVGEIQLYCSEGGTERGSASCSAGRPWRRAGRTRPERNIIKSVLQNFVGKIIQTPPRFSAIKIDGQRAYKLAREGKDFEIPSREVEIYSIEILEYNYPELKIRTHVSSGTYIRTLAEDIGKALGTGAYLTALRRTRIGDYSISDASVLQ